MSKAARQGAARKGMFASYHKVETTEQRVARLEAENNDLGRKLEKALSELRSLRLKIEHKKGSCDLP